ncbi:MAG: lipocalin family protein [Candidatus Competibacteraceae bacterium]|nr:lipocalin family protein [Candidatus Competibacteraceae bacterium]
MKQLVMLFMLFALVSCGGGPSVEGKWKLKSVGGETLSESEMNTTVNFEKSGAFSLNREGSERKGTWTYNKDAKLIVIKEDDGTNQEWTGVSLTNDEMTFTDRSQQITLQRMK